MENQIVCYLADTASEYWRASDSCSSNIVPIVPTKNGKSTKRAKGICRITGPGHEIDLINKLTVHVCEMMNNKVIDASIFGGKKSMDVLVLQKKLVEAGI